MSNTQNRYVDLSDGTRAPSVAQVNAAGAIVDPSAATAAGEAHIGSTVPGTNEVTAEITISATGTSHAAGDAVGGILTFTDLVRVNGGSAMITMVRISTNKKSITPRPRLHLYNASNATVAADDAAWKDLYADRTKRQGYIDLPAMTTPADTSGSDMSRTLDATVRHQVKAAAGTKTIYGYVETLDAVTTDNNQTLSVTLEVVYLS